jgi:hypothetical protein
VTHFSTLDLAGLPRRTVLMAVAACLALAVDFASKSLTVAFQPDSLLFNVSEVSPFGLGARPLILLAAASSLLACVLPFRLVALGAGAALGGALGNLLSRHWWSANGGSPDFIRFADGSTGNAADLFIVGGAAMMVLAAVAWLLSTLHAHQRA